MPTPSTVIALGARGTVHEVTEDANFYYFRSDSMGCATLPFKMKKTAFTDLAKIVDGHTGTRCYVGYGQSWRTMSGGAIKSWVAGYSAEPESALTFHQTNSAGARSVLGPTVGVYWPGSTFVDDICGMSLNEPITLDRVAAVARARWRRKRVIRQFSDFHFTFGYPSSGWDWGGSGGAGLNENSPSWANGIAALNRLRTILTGYGLSVALAPLSWTQGGDPNKNLAGNLDDLAQLRHHWGEDAAGGAAQPLFIGIAPGGSSTTEMPVGAKAQIQYCRDNVGSGIHLTFPWYMLRLTSTGPGDDGSIHFDSAGMVRYGAVEGYVQAIVEAGVVWTPFWLTRDVDPVRVDGQEVVVTFDAPPGGDFDRKAPRVITRDDEPDLPGLAESHGFRVKRAGTF